MRLFKVALASLAMLFCSIGFAAATVAIDVDMSSQTMHVQSSSGASYDWPVSTAGRGYATPRGTYRVQKMEVMHRSRKYHNSPMPHSMFFTGGYAIHGTYAERNLGRAASHGCVRLSRANAATLFALVQNEGGARITLTGSPQTSTQLAVDGHKKRTQVASARHHKHHTMMASNHHHRATMTASSGGAAPMAYAPAPRKKSLFDWLSNPRGN